MVNNWQAMSNSHNLRLLSNNCIFFKKIRIVFVFDELTKNKRLFAFPESNL